MRSFHHENTRKRCLFYHERIRKGRKNIFSGISIFSDVFGIEGFFDYPQKYHTPEILVLLKEISRNYPEIHSEIVALRL